MGNELTSLQLEPGWYRHAFGTAFLYECGSEEACIGGDGGNGTEPYYW